MAAGFASVVCRKLKQPAVLGYIIAGFFVGPYFEGLPTVMDTKSIAIWAEIGVIFLLFALGLEFSFRKLARVGGAASITAVVEVAVMMAIGFGTGQIFGWSTMDSLFLGGILAISSTTIIIRAFEEVGVKTRGFVHLVLGVLIVEDLVAIVMLVLLSTVAISREFAGLELLGSIGKFGFFLIVWFLFGIFFLPTLLRRVRPFVNQETLLIMAVGLCFMMVVLATKAGFSPALGAFIMGSLMAETTDAERIEHLIQPVKDLFAAVFFVSVGMMIQPSVLAQYAVPIAVITIVTILGKILSTSFGALLAGRSMRHSVQAGFSLAQIGEFSFIIATLGQTLKVTSDFLYPIAVSVSAITTFSTPYLIRSADPAVNWLEKNMPQSLANALHRYSSSAANASNTSEWSVLIRSYLVRLVVNGTLIAVVFLLTIEYLPQVLSGRIEDARMARLITVLAAVILSAPFAWAFAIARPNKPAFRNLWAQKRYRAALTTVELARIALVAVLYGVMASRFVSIGVSVVVTILAMCALFFFFSRQLKSFYGWIESQFIQNLSERERNERGDLPPLAPWDAHITRFAVGANSHVAGKSLMELQIREHFGVTIAMIERGSRRITAPTRDERLLPLDKLAVIGTDEQLVKFGSLLETSEHTEEFESPEEFVLQPVSVPAESMFRGKTIRNSGLREQAKGLVVGVERSGERTLNPDSGLEIETGDRLWIVGDRRAIRTLRDAGQVE